MKIADRIHIVEGDLTEMDVDAIVNAANNDLQLGGGVAGAIRRKGGPEIQKECDEIGQVPVGGAALTTGGKLKARYVIHAASMQLGGKASAHSLRSSTAHSLRIATQKGLKTIAFPAIGVSVPISCCAKLPGTSSSLPLSRTLLLFFSTKKRLPVSRVFGPNCK
jgi:O-acetyl-ADP-ribose deacetylase (regulator of RNase III)